jgi:hypothetical protein
MNNNFKRSKRSHSILKFANRKDVWSKALISLTIATLSFFEQMQTTNG